MCGGKWVGIGVSEWEIEKLEILLQRGEEQEVLVEAMDSIVWEEMVFGEGRSSSGRRRVEGLPI